VSLTATAKAARDLAGDWLAHLRRDPRGFPIPWINRWGPETAACTRVAYDPHVGRRAVFHNDHGEVPDFTRQSMQRQRQAMVLGLCQVCARPTPWSRRNLVVADSTAEMIEVDGRQVGAVSEPWLDDRCAAIATLLCPALIRRRHEDNFRVLPVRSPREVTLAVSTGRVDVDHEALPDAGDPVQTARLAAEIGDDPHNIALWVKAVPHRLRITAAV
jgi:hypothetical protein